MYICMCGSCSLVSDCAALDAWTSRPESERRVTHQKSLVEASPDCRLSCLSSHSDHTQICSSSRNRRHRHSLPVGLICVCILSVASQKVLYLVHALTKGMSRNIETSARAIACTRGDARTKSKTTGGFSPKSLRGRHLGARAAQSRSFHELVV
jgi:hypothetical protein